MEPPFRKMINTCRCDKADIENNRIAMNERYAVYHPLEDELTSVMVNYMISITLSQITSSANAMSNVYKHKTHDTI